MNAQRSSLPERLPLRVPARSSAPPRFFESPEADGTEVDRRNRLARHLSEPGGYFPVFSERLGQKSSYASRLGQRHPGIVDLLARIPLSREHGSLKFGMISLKWLTVGVSKYTLPRRVSTGDRILGGAHHLVWCCLSGPDDNRSSSRSSRHQPHR